MLFAPTDHNYACLIQTPRTMRPEMRGAGRLFQYAPEFEKNVGQCSAFVGQAFVHS